MSKDAHRPSLAEHEIVESPRRFPGNIKDVYSIAYDTGGGLDSGVPSESDEEAEDSNEDGGDDDRSWTPTGLRVISQSLRRLDNGFLFVDVVLGWDPLPGVDEYRLRVSGSLDA